LRDGAEILRIENLSRRFGVRQVVKRLDLRVAAGERVALWGPNGSGKTTILRCVAGTVAPTGGRVLIDSFPAGSIEARQRVGASLSQERSFYLRLSGHTNLLLFALLRHGNPESAARDVAQIEDELELGEIVATRVDRCSTGMVQQVALARALLGAPKLLILDEPTRSLDADAVHRLWNALDRRPSTAVLLATHREDDIRRCEKRIDLPL
jgi:ABC-type multidrug transport system ATPase subunit